MQSRASQHDAQIYEERRTPSQVLRPRPIRAGDVDSSGDARLEGGTRDRASLSGTRVASPDMM